MNEELLSMRVNENKIFDPSKYDVLQQTKSRLKRNGKGEWISTLSGFKGEKSLTVKRIR